MYLSKLNLSSDEISLLVDMTDFGVPLYELLNEIRLTYPKQSSDEHIETSKKVLLGIINKGLASLCRLTLENTKDFVYEVNESTVLNVNEVKDHISQFINWNQSANDYDNEFIYELAPTELGEEVLDELFDIKKST